MDGAWIATREYFKNRFQSAVRQKTRWTIGIAIQGTAIIGWNRSFIENLFLLRDRKAPLLSILSVFGLIYSLWIAFLSLFASNPVLAYSASDRVALVLALGYGLYMALERVRLASSIFGWQFGLTTFLRWPAATLINGVAALRATHQYFRSVARKKVVEWEKTEHELPLEFVR
ncbi:MAG: hypothetical protein AAB425_11955 [Bdellovibrionota bacterium]